MNEENKQTANKNMKICKHCGAQIAKSAKVCPSCGGKNAKPIYLRWWFIVLVVLAILSAIGGGSASNSAGKTGGSSTATAAPKQTEKPIEYIPYTVDEMMDDLNANPLKAKDKYNKQYVRITGELSVIDSDGKYISVIRADKYSIIGVHCSIKNDAQKAAIMEMKTGDTITICGKITDVGEVAGYYLDIASIEQ